jgi:SRSO17 transposase
MGGGRSDWRKELGRFLKPFLDRLGHKARRQMCPVYVSGLVGPGGRKSIQPTLAATIKARWICEQAHQQLKEELGLHHFEGRSWQGLHRHALMTMIAYAFLQHRRLVQARRKKKNQRASASANHARRTSRHRRSHPSTAVSAMPVLPKTNP